MTTFKKLSNLNSRSLICPVYSKLQKCFIYKRKHGNIRNMVYFQHIPFADCTYHIINTDGFELKVPGNFAGIFQQFIIDSVLPLHHGKFLRPVQGSNLYNFLLQRNPLPFGQPAVFKVENPGNDPGCPDFRSGAYTMFANSPLVEIKGLEPLTDTV